MADFALTEKVFESYLGLHRFFLLVFCGNGTPASWLTCRESWGSQHLRFRPVFFFFFFKIPGSFSTHYYLRGASPGVVLPRQSTARLLPTICTIPLVMGWQGRKVAWVFVFTCYRSHSGAPGVDIFIVVGGHLPPAHDVDHVAAVLPVQWVSREETGTRCSRYKSRFLFSVHGRLYGGILFTFGLRGVHTRNTTRWRRTRPRCRRCASCAVAQRVCDVGHVCGRGGRARSRAGPVDVCPRQRPGQHVLQHVCELHEH